jgi:hypothetical protein
MRLRRARLAVMMAALSAAIVMSSLKVGAQPSNAEAQPSLKDEVYLTVSLVQIGKTSNERSIAAQLLCELTRGNASRQVDDPSLDSIIALLDSDDDSVRYWVALCLGNFGPRAKAATPKLLKIVDQTDCVKASKTSASAARVTLKRIGAEVPSSKCK